MGCDLIVNADDLGMSEAVNHGILSAHRDGIVTASSLMAGGEAFAHALDLLAATPTLDVGVHLTLVDGRPVLAPGRVASLTGRDGRFHRDAASFVGRYVTGRIRLAEVRAELEAQLARVADAGLKPSHLDGHQHLHVLPGIWPIACDLARRFGIEAVRRPREGPQVLQFALGAGIGRLAQMLVLGSFCLRPVPRPLRAADRFAGFAFGGGLDRARLLALIELLPEHGSVELMCHPGLDPPAARAGHHAYRPADELAALTDPAVRDRIGARGIRLIGFRDLAAGE